MRRILVLAVIAMTVTACMHSPDPVAPPNSPDFASTTASNVPEEGPYRLWAEYTFYFGADHQSVEVVPARQSRFHLNALKFLEEYCSDCLKVTNIKNNGDSTIDLTVRIRHPFPGHPEYTGFDVKGIIMFNGSWTNPGHEYDRPIPPWPEPFRVSWRGMGDPQLLNGDGYTLRWSPSYDSGRSEPIFNYWEGRYAEGTPTANINAYLNFYTDENRHMFRDYGVVTRTYHIWLPPGPVVAGYAVEACWEPPLITPVTNPADDFPLTANQAEAYEFRVVLNSGVVITDPWCCNVIRMTPTECYAISKQWGGHTAYGFYVFGDYFYDSWSWQVCDDEWPERYCGVFNTANYPDGDFIGVGVNLRGAFNPARNIEIAYTLFEFTIDFQ